MPRLLAPMATLNARAKLSATTDGTQDVFYDDPTVLTVSIHRGADFFPRTGAAVDVGRRAHASHAHALPSRTTLSIRPR